MNRLLLALALPLVGLATLWGWTDYKAGQGTDWDVPVAGYDPRDLLRGHYITFRYDWPGLSTSVSLATQPSLCLIGEAPVIRQVIPEFDPDTAMVPPPDCSHFVRAGDRFGLDRGILYVPQDKAAGLEKQLADPALQGVVTIRVREDGHITPLRIAFRPRPGATPTPGR